MHPGCHGSCSDGKALSTSLGGRQRGLANNPRSLLPRSSCLQPLAEGPTGGVDPTSGRTASMFRSPTPRRHTWCTNTASSLPPHTSKFARPPGSGTLWRTLRSRPFSVPRPDRALLMAWAFPCRQVLAVTMRSLQGLSPEQVTTRSSVSMACTESPAPCIWKFVAGPRGRYFARRSFHARELVVAECATGLPFKGSLPVP